MKHIGDVALDVLIAALTESILRDDQPWKRRELKELIEQQERDDVRQS